MHILTTADMLLLLISHTAVLLRVTAQHNLTPFGTSTQSSTYNSGIPQNAINPPVSNVFSFDICSHTGIFTRTPAWWMFQFSFGIAYITDITINYRESFSFRMDGFKLYVTNTSTILPNGYLCYEDPDPGLPNITQTIPCNQLGQYVIYYDTKGDSNYGPIIELCYVAINGCRKSFWGSNCEKVCSEYCIERHCYPGNGSCIWGCKTEYCLNDICNKFTGICTDGCKERRTGDFCNKYNLAYDSSVFINPNGSYPGSLANDGSKISCSKTKGPSVTFQVDLKKESIVTGVHVLFGENTTKVGSHTLYASNTSHSWKTGTILYEEQFLPTKINVSAVFRYLTYVPPVQGKSSELEICEIGIIGCPPSRYGPVCNKLCPGNCNGPCDLATGSCTFGCLNGWTGDKCEQECQDSKYGKNCLETCSANCVNPQCNKLTGECIGGCNDGWQEFECTRKCPFGQFGKNCSEFCEGCLSQMCDHVNGLCDNSTACRPGYVYDEYCNTACRDGLYGSNCLQICSPFCLHVPCDRRIGECIGGCIHGLQGFNCMQVSVNTVECNNEVATWIGIFSGGVLFGIFMTVVVCVVIRKKRQLQKKQSKDKASTKTQSHDQQHYDDVRMENVSTYQELRKDTESNEYDQINTAYINH
ncbi:multiple epidermal growth factor-like domains protein 10 isoform X1 [Mytilus californianus]|uniref:multiple epidermal growth factor-like domains protein 10 isoform X1 n=1 Tax=Mytilus californianus TaxID=6549 RepID=UPI0022459D55|nr:multiple epidermal growth factor-like domains protein 10 isoform X1 [Mytilus californianus]